MQTESCNMGMFHNEGAVFLLHCGEKSCYLHDGIRDDVKTRYLFWNDPLMFVQYLLCVYQAHAIPSLVHDLVDMFNFLWPCNAIRRQCTMLSSDGNIFRITGHLCRSLVNSPHKGQWRGALMFSLICARINGWINNLDVGDLRHSLWCLFKQLVKRHAYCKNILEPIQKDIAWFIEQNYYPKLLLHSLIFHNIKYVCTLYVWKILWLLP